MNLLNKVVSTSSGTGKNKKIIRYDNINNQVQNWSLPKLSSQKVYKSIDSFLFKCDYIVKTAEETISLKKGMDTFQLLSENLINQHKNDYKYIHLGMVQIALKPLTRPGLDTTSFMILYLDVLKLPYAMDQLILHVSRTLVFLYRT